MKCIEMLNKKLKNMDIFDVSLTKLAVFFMTLFLVKVFPELLALDWYVYIIIGIVFAIRPMYHYLKK
jgi:hypothetical protein